MSCFLLLTVFGRISRQIPYFDAAVIRWVLQTRLNNHTHFKLISDSITSLLSSFIVSDAHLVPTFLHPTFRYVSSTYHGPETNVRA